MTYKTFVRTKATTEAFFVSRVGMPLTVETVQKTMEDIAKAAGVPRLHAHLLRHTSATLYLTSGGDAISLQQKLGHTTLAMTTRYVHVAAEQAATIEQRVAPIQD